MPETTLFDATRKFKRGKGIVRSVIGPWTQSETAPELYITEIVAILLEKTGAWMRLRMAGTAVQSTVRGGSAAMVAHTADMPEAKQVTINPLKSRRSFSL